MNPNVASRSIISATPAACKEINAFSERVLQIRGGRVGSGMGVLLEALWGYYVNRQLLSPDTPLYEIAWLTDHEYNDFACVAYNQPWASATRTGELLRIEAKSMNADADESKGHFDELASNLGEFDLLLVLIWRWRKVDDTRVHPFIEGNFIGPARPVAHLRDQLHIARGGSFVDRARCPDGCAPESCPHHGEPLNAASNRERRSGPATGRSGNVSYAANFGGLRRMLYTRGPAARQVLQTIRRQDDVCHQYISLIHKSFPDQEASQYSVAQWQTLAVQMGIQTAGLPRQELIALIRSTPGYIDALRTLA